MRLGLTMLSKPLIQQRGIIGDAAQTVVYSLGGGCAADLIDKKLAKGFLSSKSFDTGQKINGKPVTLNLTDALYLLITAGLKIPKKPMDILMTAAGLFVKKYAENYDFIDPVDGEIMDPSDPHATNVTRGRIARAAVEEYKRKYEGKISAFPNYVYRGNYE